MVSENVYGAYRPANFGEALVNGYAKGQEMAESSARLSDLARKRKREEAELAEDQQIKGLYSQHTGQDGKLNQVGLLSDLVKLNPAKAMAAQEHFAKLGKMEAEAKGAEVESKSKALEAQINQHGAIAQLAMSAKDQASYDAALARASEMGMDVSNVPKQFDPALVKSLAYNSLKQSERLTAERDAFDRQHKTSELSFNKQKHRDTLAQSDRHKHAELAGNANLVTQKGQQELAAIRARAEEERKTKGVVSADTQAKLAAAQESGTSQEKAFKRLPMENQEQITGLAKKQTTIKAINNEIRSAFAQLSDPSLSEDDKVKVGQGLLKTLNSTQGSDAVGAEESKRLGSYLEYKIANFTGPGSFIGRDLDEFTKQVGLTSQKLDSAMDLNNAEIERLYGRRNDQAERIALQPDKDKQGGGPDLIKDAKAGKQLDNVDNNPAYFKALKFIKENPNDPRAKAMLEKLKGGQ